MCKKNTNITSHKSKVKFSGVKNKWVFIPEILSKKFQNLKTIKNVKMDKQTGILFVVN